MGSPFDAKRRGFNSEAARDSLQLLPQPMQPAPPAPALPQPLTTDAYNKHYHIPVVVSGYLQLVFNILWLLCIIFLATVFVLAIRGDISLRTSRSTEALLADIKNCAHEYQTNKCDEKPSSNVLQHLCQEWATCMNRDPSRVEITSISVKAVAEALNSFIEPISYKTMVFIALLVFIICVSSNCMMAMTKRNLSNQIPNNQSFAITPYNDYRILTPMHPALR
ncbi:hypothetical protein RCL1_003596 [Eukaryota sp. TZLM3-RCL]